MKIYRVSIVNHGWSGNTIFMEKYYTSISTPNKIKEKFERICKSFKEYFERKKYLHRKDNDLSLWAHYQERFDLLNSVCNINEIEVILSEDSINMYLGGITIPIHIDKSLNIKR